MPVSLNGHLQYKMDQSDNKNILRIAVGARSDKILSIQDEAVRAAKQIVDAAGQSKVGLLLEPSYESLALFYSFLNAGVEFDVYVLNYVNLKQNAPRLWLEKVLAGSGKTLQLIDFDFNIEEHLIGIEKIQENTDCADLSVLFNIWASCQMDGEVVLPGSFIIPQFNRAMRLTGWSLPGFAEHSIYRFFDSFGGVPFFFSYSADLIYAQAESNFSRQLTTLAHEGRYISDTLELRRQFYADAGFPLTDETKVPFRQEDFFRTAVKFCDRDKKERLYSVQNRAVRFQYDKPASSQFLDINPYAPERINVPVSEELRRESHRNDIRGALFETTIAGDHGCYATFPTLVSRHQFRGNLKKPLTVLQNIEFFRNQGNMITRSDLHFLPEMAEVVDFFKRSVEYHLKQMAYIYDEIEITQCWANRSTNTQFHHHHYHPNCFLSGFFYLSSGGGSNTVFRSNHHDQQIKPQCFASNLWNSSSAEVTPEAGKLILFPAHLEHHTLEHQGEDARYTMSFNVIFRGEIGAMSGLSWLKM